MLHDIDLEIAPNTRVAVVGETGSGKTTFAKLLTRLMDPTSGAVRLDGVDLRDVPFASLRERVVLVPQEGFLFDATLRGERALRQARRHRRRDPGRPSSSSGWPTGWTPCRAVSTPGSASAASRCRRGSGSWSRCVRAHLADPDLLVLDEATSAVDPALEMRIARALERLQRGRTSVTIAHRMSTAENADEVVVVDTGRIVQRGPHAALVAEGGVYGRLHASWVAQQSVR